MEKLTRKEVEHVASLGRIILKEEEKDKYARDLYLLLNEINKIKELNIDGDILIAPTENKCVLREDSAMDHEDPTKLISNAPNNSLNFIEVAGVFDE